MLNMVNAYARACVEVAPQEHRVMLHVALMGVPGDVLNTAGNRTIALAKNVSALRRLTFTRVTADRIFDMLKQAKAWSDGSGIDDLVMAIAVGMQVRERFLFTPHQLYEVVNRTKAVTSEKYMGVYGPGKALGAAIERGRKEAIALMFDLRDDDVLVDEEL